MNAESSGPPKEGLAWFNQQVDALRASLPTDEEQRFKLLADSRSEFYAALQVYYTQVKYSTSSVFAILGGTFAILKFAPQDEAGSVLASSGLLVALGLFLGASLCIFFLIAAGGQYSLYLSAVIFSAKLHFACGIVGHAWFDGVRDYAHGPSEIGDVNIAKNWMLSWMKRKAHGRSSMRIPNTFITYAAVMLLLCISGYVGSIYFLFSSL